MNSHIPSKILYIDSRDASQYLATDITTGYDLTSYFKYTLTEKIEVPDNQVIFVSLNSTTIPYSFYNIRLNVNDKIDVAIDTQNGADPTYINETTKTIVIPAGNYSSISLGNYLEGQLTSDLFNVGNVGTNYAFTSTIDYDNDTQKYLITFTPDGISAGLTLRLRLLFSTGSNNGNHSNIEIGFRSDEDISYTSNTGAFASTITSFSSTNVVDINGSIHGVYIRTNLTSNSTLDSQNGTFSNILARIPIKVQSGGIIFREPNNSVHKALTQHKNISQISIRLTDERNRLLDLNGLHFQIAVQFDFDYLENVLPPETAEERRQPYGVDNIAGNQSQQAIQNYISQQNLVVKNKGGRPRKVGRPKKKN
tara:strand:+ start:4118 stop:5215 length:1098 start_codon:yes stop_codon:yes gene_type:complete